MTVGFRRRPVLVLAAFVAFVLALASPLGVSAQSSGSADLRSWERKDSSTTCDEIGWNLDGSYSGSMDDEDFFVHHAACVGSVAYVAFCGTIAGDGMFFEPPSGQLWIACLVMAANAGSSDVTVSLFDFSLVGANGRKYDQDFMAQASLDASRMFSTATLRQGQNVDGLIAFSVPKSGAAPFTLEIDPMLNFSLGGSDPGYIVIPKWVSFRDPS